MRQLFLTASFVAFGVACGGAVENDAPSPAPATNVPNSMNDSDGCARACARMTSTCRAYEDPSCADSCSKNFDSADQARTFAACIDALSCEDIQRGATMDYGPIGECWSKARGR